MPLEFAIDHELNALVVRADGVVDVLDFMNSIDQVEKLPGFTPGMNQLVDLGSGELDLDEGTSRQIAGFFQGASVRAKLGSDYKLAFVAPRPVDFGLARMHEFHAMEGLEAHGVEMRVFYSLEQAKQWLLGERV